MVCYFVNIMKNGEYCRREDKLLLIISLMVVDCVVVRIMHRSVV